MFETAGEEKVRQYGSDFLASFRKVDFWGPKTGGCFTVLAGTSKNESHHSIKLVKDGACLAEAKLGFGQGVVVIESLQGTQGLHKKLNEFRHNFRSPWANFLIQKVEEHARKCGFEWVAIRRPETLFYYDKPVRTASEKEKEEIRARMRLLYNNAANAMGYRKAGYYFFVNRL
ncbi:MAG: hypothetical protein WC634_00590 [archaeon]